MKVKTPLVSIASIISKIPLSIRSKIILCIYLVPFPVLIVAGAYIYFRDYRSIMKESSTRYRNAVEQADESVAYLMRDSSDISVYFCINADILKILSSASSQWKDPLFWVNQAPMAFIRDILAIKSNIRTLILYPENGLPPFYVSHDASVHNPSIGNIRGLDMYRTAVNARGDIILARVEAGESGLFLRNTGGKIILCREIFDLSKQRQLGFLALSMDVSGIEAIYRNTLLQDNEAMVMKSAGRELIVQVGETSGELLDFIRCDDEAIGPVPAASERPRRVGAYYVFTSSRNGSERHYYISPKSNWDAWIRRDLYLPALLAFALIVSIWPLSFLASRIISRPLDRLYHSMNRFKQGDFNAQVPAEGNDEIAALTRTFNSMVREIKELIDRNYVIVLRERESELNALQAQINPHFLYNVLDSLYWQAADSGQEKLAEDIISLSDLFRLTLSSGASEIPVEQEVKIIASYLRIQKMRFSKKLEYSIKVEDAVLSHPIPKLILQPFVENAVVHGLEHSGSGGLITVEGKFENGMLYFVITDNGAGMGEEQIAELLGEAENPQEGGRGKTGCYGIRNVRERMTLRYGGRGSLEISRRQGGGTEVRMVIPAWGEEDG